MAVFHYAKNRHVEEFLCRTRDGWDLGKTPELFISPRAAFAAFEDWRSQWKAAGKETPLLDIIDVDL